MHNPDPLLDIIWNATALCGWNCADCCVSALQVTRHGSKVHISDPMLQDDVVLERDPEQGSMFDQALRLRQARGLELTLTQKLQVLDHLVGNRVRLDVSGGDVLSPSENYILLERAAARLGSDHVTLTATGAGLANYDIDRIKGLISELNFTYDGQVQPTGGLRPLGYARGNLRRAKLFSDAGVAVRAECPLNARNVDPESVATIYRELHESGVDRLLVMRLFPSGRGELRPGDIPSKEEYKVAIATLRELEARYGKPLVKLQCALRHIEGRTAVNPCDAFTESFGLMWDGTLLGSPWAISARGKPIDEAWVLGNLVESSLTDILATERVQGLRARASENHGQCKFFAWTYGNSPRSEDRIFERSDPMYAVSSGGAS
jgi:MoaA/NifB/PqqE/SkfB family radical SAM enzyme